MNASAHLVTLFDVGSHAPRGSSLSLVTCHPCTCAFLLEFTSLFFYFDLSFPVFFFSFHLHTELDNLIAMQNLRNFANKGSNDAYDVRTSLTGYEPTSWPSASSTTLQVPSPILSRHRTRTQTTLHSASCSPRHTEDKPITAIQKACQSVSRRRLLCSIELGNLREKEMSINQLVLGSRETRTVLTVSFLKTPKLRKWSIDQGNLRSEKAQMHRLGLYLKNRDK